MSPMHMHLGERIRLTLFGTSHGPRVGALLNGVPAGIEIGITHVYDPDFEDDHIRTPLGGFINHSDRPNCEIKGDETDITRKLFTLQKIEQGKELTAKYDWYEPAN